MCKHLGGPPFVSLRNGGRGGHQKQTGPGANPGAYRARARRGRGTKRTKGTCMSIGKRVLAAAAGLTLAAGAAIGATSAFASTAGCSFGDGCATLHGVNAAGNPVAMDAKYKNEHEILIGYPDNACCTSRPAAG
jgi:hypothetical protein